MNSFIDAKELSSAKEMNKSKTELEEIKAKIVKLEEENKILKEEKENLEKDVSAEKGSVSDKGGEGEK